MLMTKWLHLALAMALAGIASPALAQEFPAKPIRIIIPLAPGGVTDSMGRLLAQKYSEAWKQPGIVENKPGAAGMIAAETVARAAPDGYTLLVGHIGTHGVNPALYARMSYDPVKDFAPIAMLVTVPNFLVVHPSVPANSVEELIRLARAKPGSLNASSPGPGTSGHMGLAVFKSMTGADITHIPYKGPAPALQAALAGEVQLLFDTIASTLPHVKAGRLKALGVTELQRSNLAPQVPTLDEQGLTGFSVSPWFALFAPAGTPPAVIDKIHAETVRILTSAEITERLQAQGLRIEVSSPKELAAHVSREIARWGKVVRDAGITPE